LSFCDGVEQENGHVLESRWTGGGNLVDLTLGNTEYLKALRVAREKHDHTGQGAQPDQDRQKVQTQTKC
jgi:hypothetical protein